MSQLTSQTVIAIMQLLLTTFQFVLMIVTSYRPWRIRQLQTHDEETSATTFQRAISTSFAANPGLDIQAGSLAQRSLQTARPTMITDLAQDRMSSVQGTYRISQEDSAQSTEISIDTQPITP